LLRHANDLPASRVRFLMSAPHFEQILVPLVRNPATSEYPPALASISLIFVSHDVLAVQSTFSSWCTTAQTQFLA
jgi:hypothetical protein